MNKLKAGVWVVLASFSLTFAGSAYADENPLVALKNQMAESDKAKAAEVASLKNQVNDLNKKLAMFESKLSNVEGKVGGAPAYAQAAPADTSNLNGIEVHGFIDTQYNLNFRQPGTPNSTQNSNSGRVFDNKDGTFAVNAAEIDIAKTPLEPGQAGFRTDVSFGEDANVVNGSGTTATLTGAGDATLFHNNKVDLQQAYVEYIAPLNFFEGNSILPSSVDIKAGRFVTLAGLEVIEAPDNWNISRSMMFGFGIPFTHTGVRTNFGLWNDFFDVYLGVNNGWDQAVDNNGPKTLESAIGYTLFEKLHMFHTFYSGKETAGSDTGNRWLNTNTATYDVTDKLSIMGEINEGDQRGVQSTGTTVPRTENVNWYGFAGYAKYQFTPKFALSTRSELFVDANTFRAVASPASTPINSDRTWGQTFTAEYKLTDQLISRGELRFDKSDDDRIYDSSDTSQVTIGAQMIYVV